MTQKRAQRHVDLPAFEHGIQHPDDPSDDPAAHGIDEQCEHDLQHDPHGIAEHPHEKRSVIHVHDLVDRLGEVRFLHAVGQHQRLQPVGLKKKRVHIRFRRIPFFHFPPRQSPHWPSGSAPGLTKWGDSHGKNNQKKENIPIFVLQKRINDRTMESKVEIIQINISGEDKPGMTSSLTEILARYDAFVLDIGQANIHQSLTLGILFRTTSDKSGNIMKELLFKASELGVMIRFTPISEADYNGWVSLQGRNRYIITLLGRQVTARHIAEVTRVVAEHGLNIDAIRRLTGRVPLREDDRAAKSCIELSVRGSLDDAAKSAMQERFMNLSDMGLDVSFQKDDIYRRSRRLICFDMDSTLIETEVIDELAERAGVGDRVRAITASAMRGEIDFRESFTQRVALLKGLDVSVMEDIARRLPITEGLERMMTILKRVGYKTAILSGGFTYFGNYLRQKYGFDYVYANELEIEDGRLTGRFSGEVVDGRRKAELLRLLCQFEEINIAQSVAVGDGANDLPMLSIAGLGIAFHAKPKVKATARQSISTIGLDGILYFLGLKDSRIE